MNMKVTKLKKNGSLLPGHSRGVFLLQLSDSSRPGNPSAWLFINEDCALVTE